LFKLAVRKGQSLVLGAVAISALLPQKATGVVVMEAALRDQRAALVLTGAALAAGSLRTSREAQSRWASTILS
jgi:hypothetical protein